MDHIGIEPQLLMIKHESIEDRVPSRKRSGTISVPQEVARKRVKADPENSLTAELDAKPPSMSTEAMRNELTDLQAMINHLQPRLDRAKRKNGKSIEQLTKERSLTSQLIELYRRKKELTEMIPAISTHAHSIAGPSYRNGFTDAFAQPRQPVVLGPNASALVASGSNLPSGSTKDEPINSDSDDDVANPLPVSDMDHSHSFEDDNNQMLVDDINLGADFCQYNTAKADEWVHFLTPASLPLTSI
jgi:hypothetical protein